MKTKQKTSNNSHIVGVGASAGGLHAFSELLQAIPEDSSMAFVLIQHLDPKQRSLLPEMLVKSTSIPVTEVRGATKVKMNHVYIMPSGKDMIISDSTLHLVERKNRSAIHRPIDTFFESLAKAHKELAIGVILSGTGADGTKGLEVIKSLGGLTLVQDRSAEFKGMPESAIDAGVADFILSPSAIVQKILQIVANPRSDKAIIDTIFNLLKANSGIDFSKYRSTTVHRRLQRRMMLNHLKNLEEYHMFLTKNPNELETLHKDMLISVTHFFREAEQLQVLKKTVFPNLLKNRSSKEPISVWIPGCATGEEVYSFAILLYEFLSSRRKNIPLQILGTDISGDAISKAREGMYQEDIKEYISAKRLRQFFNKVTDGYKVRKTLLSVCKFLVHDVIDSPPVANVDLISCRNVIIYLGPTLQQKALSQLHWALAPDGFLVLGKSEGIGRLTKLFQPLDSKQKIYTKDTTGVKQKIIDAKVSMDTIPIHKKSTKKLSDGQLGTGEQLDRQQKVTKLREALSLAQEYADSIINELDVMNEELQSANEELAASNEELQSTNEELETAQEELRASNEELKILNTELEETLDYANAIIATVREPLLVLNGNLKVRGANQSFYNTFQVQKAETEGKLLYDLGEGQWDIPALRKLLLEILPKGNYFQDFEVVHKFPSIGQKIMLLNARRLVQKDKKEALILLAIEDVSEQRRIENIIRQSEEFSLLVQNASDILTIFGKNGIIKYQSPSIERILGYKPQERLGKNIFNDPIVHPDDLDENKRLLKDIIVHPREIVTAEIRLRQRSGAWLTFEAIYQNLLRHPRIGGIIANYRDITERKKFEQRKDDFIALASHELKTPITSLKMFAQVIEQRFKKIGDLESAKHLTSMDKQLNKLTELVNGLLDLSRVQGGKLEYKKDNFAIDSLTAETVGNMQRVAEGHKLILKGRTEQKVIADADRIGQVLINLITNAIKYSPKAEKVIITLGHDRDNVIISVQDFGVGIPKSEQEKIFERFYQASDTSGGTFPGLGLGLYICTEIIERHNGKIWVDSTPGKGSTFSFSLPIARSNKQV